ncbi:hypothetical protein ACGFNP_38715 [Nonomuraea sp. NPDC049269]|uniref:hypothetical protein n=1 Tax=Nonomuraea sp. NPDC049269 TaxID=3364349 RepID=UPI003723CE06
MAFDLTEQALSWWLQGTSLLMLMAKSRHKKPENVRRCFKPSPEAIAELTSLLAPGGGNR